MLARAFATEFMRLVAGWICRQLPASHVADAALTGKVPRLITGSAFKKQLAKQPPDMDKENGRFFTVNLRSGF